MYPWGRESSDARFVYLFTIAYSLGEGPVAFQYSAEVFPTIQREQGMSFVVFINNFFGTYKADSSAGLSSRASRSPVDHLPTYGIGHVHPRSM
jgi:hypothetical protein